MRALILVPLAALALAACDNRDREADDMNAVAADNLTLDANLDAGGIDANAATNAATENAMVEDLTTNDADTNLANGM